MLDRLRRGLQKTRRGLLAGIGRVLSAGPAPDGDSVGQIEEFLLAADVGVQTTERLVESLRNHVKQAGTGGESDLLSCMKSEIRGIMQKPSTAEVTRGTPHVVLVVGV
ncbi:MAG: signal recognition particle receptor subunit alpha, partial [Candidatus Eisenbacteria bacterium]